MADLSNLLQLGQQMQFRLSEIQSQLAQQTVTCTAGGGIVAATADGRGQIRGIKIDPQAIAQGDVEMLEDLLLAAGSEAQQRGAGLYQAGGKETATRLAEAIRTVRARVTACGECGTLTDEDPCAICRDPRRDASVLCVVEESSDVTAIERAGRFRGRYHVLGGRLSPLEGVGPEALHLDRLMERVANGGGAGLPEVILATNPSMQAHATPTYLHQR